MAKKNDLSKAIKAAKAPTAKRAPKPRPVTKIEKTTVVANIPALGGEVEVPAFKAMFTAPGGVYESATFTKHAGAKAYIKAQRAQYKDLHGNTPTKKCSKKILAAIDKLVSAAGTVGIDNELQVLILAQKEQLEEMLQAIA